jgi:arginine-tRNA-protein transferase
MSVVQTFSHFPSWPAPVKMRLPTLPEHPCVYLPGRLARMRGFLADRLPPQLYHEFMDAGFRRSGRLLYQPACPGCRQCVPLRVSVEQFRESRSQRRCRRRNSDLRLSISLPSATEEKFDLYARYLRDWHGREDDEATPDDFRAFLYDSAVDTIEFEYRDPSGRLLAVGICDVCPESLSSVYLYFDPADSRRGLGTFGALCEIAYAREKRLAHYYLGYWVYGCASMQYKCDFRPNQWLGTDGIWRDESDRGRPDVSLSDEIRRDSA